MKKEGMKKVTNMIVDMAAKSAAMPAQCCFFFMGKPKTEIELTLNDFKELNHLLKRTK